MKEYPSSWEHWSPTWDRSAPGSPIRPLGPSVDDSYRDDSCFQTEDQREYYFEALDFEEIFNNGWVVHVHLGKGSTCPCRGCQNYARDLSKTQD